MPAVSGETTPSSADAEQRQLEAVRAERPGDVDVVGVPRAPRGHDGDVVEAVGATGLLTAADLYFHGGTVWVEADGTAPLRAGPEGELTVVVAATSDCVRS